VYDAVRVTASLYETGDLDNPTSLQRAVSAGVSAEVCSALGDLAGPSGSEPFEVGFRWARGLPSELPSHAIRLGAGAGVQLRAAARRLRDIVVPAEAEITGVIEGLADSPTGDRHRIRVRGAVRTADAIEERSLWVRLADAGSYDVAIEAHRGQRRVRVAGVLSAEGSLLDATRRGGLEVTG
jgi:hypothetical protein